MDMLDIRRRIVAVYSFRLIPLRRSKDRSRILRAKSKASGEAEHGCTDVTVRW